MNKPQRQSSKTKALLEEESDQCTKISNGRITYQIGSEIGRGGFGIVFQALNVQTGDFVAVKRFPLKAIEDESLSSIESEIELMQKLNHPNIVKYIDTIRTKDYLHIVLEYMENGSLSNVIKKFGAFTESLTAIYITQVLRGLKYLHEQGVLHRDIKGANILTTKDGMVKLADFGVAIKLSEAHENDQNVVGSPYWIAPEIIEMSAPTSACDIWSVGCIIIELLTKKPPYYDLPPMAALFRIVQDDYPPLPEGISQALRDFLLACFQKEPAMRSSAVKLLEHPWLYNSSTNPNLAQTSKLLESKATASNSSSSIEVEQSAAADSIVNTIRNHQLQAPSHPPMNLHSQSVDPAALARRNMSRKGGISLESNSAKNPRTPTKKLAAESFDYVKSSTSSSGGQPPLPGGPGITRSDSKPPLKTRLTRNATVNAKPSAPLLREDDILRKVASLDSPNIKIVSGNVIPIHPGEKSNSFKISPDKRLSPFSASQSKSPLDDNIRSQRSRSGSGSVFSDTKESIQRKDSFVLSDISGNTQGNHSTDISDDLKGASDRELNKNSMYAAGMQKINDSSDEDWDVEMRDTTGVVPASEDSMDRLLQIPREKGGLVLKTLGQSTPKGTTPYGTPKAASVGVHSKTTTPKHGSHPPFMLDQRSISAVLSAPIEEEDETDDKNLTVSSSGPSHLQRTHATVTAEALESVERSGLDDSPKRKLIARNPAVLAEHQFLQQQQRQPSLGTVHSSSFLLPNASSLSNDKAPSFVINQSTQISFLAKYKEPEEENYDDLIRKSTSEEAAAYAETFVEADDESINDNDFDDGEEAIDNTQLHRKIKAYTAPSGNLHAALTSVKGRALTRSRSLPLTSSNSRSLDRITQSHDEFDGFDDDDDGLDYEDNDEDGFSLSDVRATINPFDMAGKLRQRMKERVQEVVEDESDEFINYQFDEKDFKQNEHKDVHFRRSREVVDIMAKIRTETAESEVIEYCTQLMTIFTNYPEQREHLVTYHGVMPIIDMIEARSYAESKYGGGGAGDSLGGASLSSRRRKTLRPFVLRVINKIIEGSTRAQEQLSLVGIIPTVMNIFDRSHRSDYSQILTPAHHHYSSETPMKGRGGTNAYLNSINAQYHQNWHQQVDPVTLEAARFIHQISSTSSLTLQMLIGAGGLSVLTNMVSFGAHILPLTPLNKRNSIYGSSPRNNSGSNSSLLRFPDGGNFQSPTGASEASSLNSNNNRKKTSFLSYSEDRTDDVEGSSVVFSHFSGDSMSVDANDAHSLQRQASNESLLGSQLLGNTGINESDDSVASMQIFQMGIDCIAHVFAVQSSRTRDFCRLFVKLGLLPHLSVAFQNILTLYLTRMTSGILAGPSLPTNSSGGMPSGTNDGSLASPRKQPLTIPRMSERLTELGIGTPTNLNLSRSSSGNAPSEAAAALRELNRAQNTVVPPLDLGLPSKPSSARDPLKHHRKGSSSTDSGTLHALGQETLEESPERKYTQEIATLLFKFSRSDSVVAEMMANNDYGVVTVILTALKAPELRTVEYGSNSGGHSQTSSQHSLDGSNHGRGGSGSSSTLLSNFPQLNLAPLLIANSGTNEQAKRRSINLSANALHPTYLEIIELLLKCLKNLSMEPCTLADLEKAGVMETLIPLLSGPLSEKCRNHILPCIFNICRINKKRQETAAALGIVPHLKKVISDGSQMKQFALPILFDLAHTSAATRAELWKNDCVSFYLNLLRENYWQTFALNSLAIWLSHDTVNVGKLLIEPAQLNKLIDFFCASSVQKIQTLHKSLLDMMQKSKELARALSGSALYVTALIKILKTTSEAIVLRSLLKMLQLLHHYHVNPLQFVAEYDLYNLVKDFAQSEGQVLVCQIAEKLLADFQFTSSMATSSTDSGHTFS